MENTTFTQAMETFVQTYARSVNTCHIDLYKSLWNQDGAIFFIHPSGCDHSFSEVAQHFYLDTMDARFSKRELIPKPLCCASTATRPSLNSNGIFMPQPAKTAPPSI